MRQILTYPATIFAIVDDRCSYQIMILNYGRRKTEYCASATPSVADGTSSNPSTVKARFIFVKCCLKRTKMKRGGHFWKSKCYFKLSIGQNQSSFWGFAFELFVLNMSSRFTSQLVPKGSNLWRLKYRECLSRDFWILPKQNLFGCYQVNITLMFLNDMS